MSDDTPSWVNATTPSDTAHSGSDESDGSDTGPTASLRAGDAVVAALRHDVHKFHGRRHSAARESEYGVPVNERVPFGADQDAALLSRPDEDPEPAMQNYVAPYRLSLLTGEAAVETERIEAAAGGGFRQLVTPDDPELLHARWVTSRVPAAYNESPYYPHTSLKYHTLLVAALTDNYRAGYDFEDLYLAVSPGSEAAAARSPEAAMAADVVESARTVLWTPGLTLHVTAEPGDRPAARLGPQPTRSFADVWAQLPAHPFDVDEERVGRVLDAQLRRVRACLRRCSTSTSTHWRWPPSSEVGRMRSSGDCGDTPRRDSGSRVCGGSARGRRVGPLDAEAVMTGNAVRGAVVATADEGSSMRDEVQSSVADSGGVPDEVQSSVADSAGVCDEIRSSVADSAGVCDEIRSVVEGSTVLIVVVATGDVVVGTLRGELGVSETRSVEAVSGVGLGETLRETVDCAAGRVTGRSAEGGTPNTRHRVWGLGRSSANTRHRVWGGGGRVCHTGNEVCGTLGVAGNTGHWVWGPDQPSSTTGHRVCGLWCHHSCLPVRVNSWIRNKGGVSR